MTLYQSLKLFFASAFLFGLAYAEKGVRLEVPQEISVIVRETAMPEMDDSRVGKILERYYQEGLGGADNWKDIESLRISGTLTLVSGDFEVNAYQKKPNYIKMTIVGNHRDLVLGYDGQSAWRVLPGSNEGKASLMEHQEARRFIHSARFGNYLLYPYAHGKEIHYVDTLPIEGKICHQIRVVLDTGFQVDYYIDIRSYLEVMVKNTDLETGFVNSIVYDDYNLETGIPIAKRVESRENGEWVSRLELDEIKINTGLMPWMFSMPK